MNFTQPSDFKYVGGADLYRINIDNDIMPMRGTDTKRHLRGMDVAFLMEAVEERARLIGLDAKTYEFSRMITMAQVNEIIERYNEIVDAQEANAARPFTALVPFFVRDYNDVSVHFGKIEKHADFAAFIDLFKVDVSKIDPVDDKVIRAEKIEEIFSAVEKLTTLKAGDGPEVSTKGFVASWTDGVLKDSNKWLYDLCTIRCLIAFDFRSFAGDSVGRAEAVSGTVRVTDAAKADGLGEASWCMAYVRSGYVGSNGRISTMAIQKGDEAGTIYELPFATVKAMATRIESEDKPEIATIFTDDVKPCYDLDARTRWDI